jgi:hypothetical protein
LSAGIFWTSESLSCYKQHNPASLCILLPYAHCICSESRRAAEVFSLSVPLQGLALIDLAVSVFGFEEPRQPDPLFSDLIAAILRVQSAFPRGWIVSILFSSHSGQRSSAPDDHDPPGAFHSSFQPSI